MYLLLFELVVGYKAIRLGSFGTFIRRGSYKRKRRWHEYFKSRGLIKNGTVMLDVGELNLRDRLNRSVRPKLKLGIDR